jgi:acyl-CoA synthetase (AMP-forming)/AMP-acid ligase II
MFTPSCKSIKNSSHKSFAKQYAEYSFLEGQRWQELEKRNVQSWADVWEQAVDYHADFPVVEDIGAAQSWTYRALDQEADKIAAWAVSTQEQYIGVYQSNGAIFLAVVIGLIKAGVTAVLFNIRDPIHKLTQLANQSQVQLGLGQEIPGVKIINPTQILSEVSPGRLASTHRHKTKLSDPAVIIFTSGTSGRSKPALFSHRRLIGAGVAWSIRTGLTSNSRCYIPLPLYHGNGLAIGFASCVEAGACAVVRERFSVRAFLPDIRHYQCDAAVYIGEFWRYLMSQAAQPDDAANPLKIIFGNGLTAPLWESVVQRFGIEHVVEHYGATEMPASALTNWTGRPGYCGFIPPEHPDAANIILVNEQRQVVDYSEVGEALLRVPGGQYRGYLDPALDQDKVCRDLLEPGDLWWKSGDLLARDADGFFKFIDRLGDSFRWKGENVATLDVEEAILASDTVQEAVVYGIEIPGALGKVGMASILPKQAMDESQLNLLLAHLTQQLPPYAIPHLIRIASVLHETTATLKIRKAQLAAEGFQVIDRCPHFVLSQGQYVYLTRDRLEALKTGRLCLGFQGVR